jgi:6-phosphogluconolactonase (cycloisomerase 2 family)
MRKALYGAACATLALSCSLAMFAQATLTPTTLSFGNQVLNVASSSKTVTVKNTQAVPLTISSITIGGGTAPGDYTLGSNCPVSPNMLGAGKSCSINVTLTPSALGSRTGILTVAESATGTAQSVSLVGTGVEPAVLSVSTLNFGTVYVGNTTVAKSVTLTNYQKIALSFTSIATTGDFSIATNTCGSSIAAGANCKVGVTFIPTLTGIRTGTLTFTDSAANSPQIVNLSGTGSSPVALSATSLTFASATVGTTSTAKTVTLTNHLTTALSISSPAVSGDFAVASNTCGSAVGAGQKCTIGVTFTPTQVGTRSGSLTISYGAYGSPSVVSLTGTGNVNGLTAITVTPANPSIPLGTQQQFTATGHFSNGTTENLTNAVTWSASSAATINVSGLATTVAQGVSTITATVNAIKGTTTLMVTPPTLVSIAVTPANPSISAGSSEQFTATGTYTDGSTQNLTSTASWSSSATNFVTINATGLAAAVAPGTTTIEATSGAINGSTTLTVTAPVLSSIAVTPANSLIGIGGEVQCHAMGTYTDGSFRDITNSVTWSSSAPSAATVNNNGVVVVTGPGTATVTASSASVSGSATVSAVSGVVVTAGVGYNTPNTVKSLTITASTGAVTSAGPAIAGGGVGNQGVAIDPAGEFAYVAGEGKLWVYTIDESSGLLTPVVGSPYSVATYVRRVTVAGNGQFLYLVDGSSVYGYSIDRTTGAVSPLGVASYAVATGALALVGDSSGQHLYVAGNSSVAGFAIDASSGALTALSGSPYGTTGGQGIAIDAQGQFVYVSGSGLTVYAINSSGGTLTEVIGSPFAASVNFTGVAVDGTGTFVYGSVQGNPSVVYGFIRDAVTGVLTAVPGSPFAMAGGSLYGFGVAADGSGKFVYAVDANTGVTAYTINPSTGALTLVNYAGGGGYNLAVSSLPTTAATLQSITVQPANPTITSSSLGLQQQFTAVGSYSDGSTRFLTGSVSWSSSNSGVASISNTAGTNGLATTTGYGTTTITASLGAVSGNANLTVTSSPLTAIAVTPSNPTISVRDAIQLTATGYFADGSNGNVTSSAIWSTSNASSVNISPSGLAQALAAGQATITATMSSISGNATVTAQ